MLISVAPCGGLRNLAQPHAASKKGSIGLYNTTEVGIDCLISGKTCFNRLTNFEVSSKIEIQLQFIVLLTKVRNEVLCSGCFLTNISKCFQHKLLI